MDTVLNLGLNDGSVKGLTEQTGGDVRFALDAYRRFIQMFGKIVIGVPADAFEHALDEAKHAKFVLASTSEVYGDPLEHPQKETYWGHVNPIGPRGVYDEAKRFAEAITMAYHRYHGLDVKIVRIFNTYGPRMRIRDGRAVPNFIAQALRQEDVTIFGTGDQTRSFCYISDLVAGILALMESGVNDPVNIGNPRETTIEEIARTIIRMTGAKSRIVYKPLPTDDPKVRQPDITLAKKELGWEPRVSLHKGLSKTIGYFRTRLAARPNVR